MDMKIEVVPIPVSDLDAAKDFYANTIGFDVDIDRVVPGGKRVLQLTPPGSGCSIHLVEGAHPVVGLTVVVPDIRATRARLAASGAPVSEVMHHEDGEQVPGYSDEPWSATASFTDPDGNHWTIQERPSGG